LKYLLDTDHLTVLQRPTSADHLILSARMAAHQPDEFVVSVVSFHEQAIGCHALVNRAKKPADVLRGYALLEEVLRAFKAMTVVPFDANAATAFDGLKGLRLRTATMDLRIAATALSRGLTLLTRNRSDFAGVPGLVIEDWTV
jgi:tRNA(fMet)-specific endonuclease VapC